MKLVNVDLLAAPWNWVLIGLIAAFWLLLLIVIFPQPETGEP